MCLGVILESVGHPFWVLFGNFWWYFSALSLDVCSRCSLRVFLGGLGVPRPPADAVLTHTR